MDDFDWDARPTSTFKLRKGEEISYQDYYKKNYSIDIGDLNQPLLVSRPKKKDIKVGRTEPIYLLPELCCLTGLSEEARADFSVMKDVAAHTRIAPQGRTQTLTDFIKQINQ